MRQEAQLLDRDCFALIALHFTSFVNYTRLILGYTTVYIHCFDFRSVLVWCNRKGLPVSVLLQLSVLYHFVNVTTCS